jgi:hypothetical protein
MVKWWTNWFRFVVLPSSTYLFTVGAEGFWFSLDHTRTHATFGRTPLDEGSDHRRDLYLSTQTLYKRQRSMSPGGIRTHDPSNRSTVHLRLRPRGHWDRPYELIRTGWIPLIRNSEIRKPPNSETFWALTWCRYLQINSTVSLFLYPK